MVKLGISATLSVLAGIFLSVLERRMGFIFKSHQFKCFHSVLRSEKVSQDNHEIFKPSLWLILNIWIRCCTVLGFIFIYGIVSTCPISKNVSFKSDFSQNSGLFKISPLIGRPWIWSFKLWRFSNNLKKKSKSLFHIEMNGSCMIYYDLNSKQTNLMHWMVLMNFLLLI